MKFSKFAGSQDKPFHSSMYAEVSSGESLGTGNSQTFSQRRHIERNRRAVGRYSDSSVARGNHLQEELRHRLESPQDDASSDTDQDQKEKVRAHWQAPRTYSSRETPTSSRGSTGSNATSSQKLRVPPRRDSFKEPPTRGFNPYQ